MCSKADIREQTKLVLENAKAILRRRGCILQNVVKTTIYLERYG